MLWMDIGGTRDGGDLRPPGTEEEEEEVDIVGRCIWRPEELVEDLFRMCFLSRRNKALVALGVTVVV